MTPCCAAGDLHALIGIESMPNGQVVYNMFGALSSDSSLTNIVTEVKTLVDNVQRASEAFERFFN